MLRLSELTGVCSVLADVKHCFVDLIKWEDENGVKRELRIYSKIAHKWRQIATQLGFEQLFLNHGCVRTMV